MPSSRAEATPVTLVAGEVDLGEGDYCGYSFRNTGGGVASVQLWDSTSAGSGLLLDTVALTASGSAQSSQTQHYGKPGRWRQNGIFAVITGTVEGSVFV